MLMASRNRNMSKRYDELETLESYQLAIAWTDGDHRRRANPSFEA